MPYLDALPAGSASGRLARVRRILAADRDRREGSAAVVDAASGGFRDERLDAAGDRVLSQIEALERAKAGLESRLLDAYAALHTILEQQLVRFTPTAPIPLSADRLVTAEIACATGVGQGEVSRRLELALAPRRHRVLHAGLRAGTVSLYRALTVVAETRTLPDATLPALEELVLAPAPDGSVASQRLFRSRLRRAVTAADARGLEERRPAATLRRGVFGRLTTEDGMGVITLTASAERVVGALDRVDALARAARAAGDGRTLDQLRSDLLTDLALFGTTPDGPTATAPAAVVRIVVPFEVATGTSDAACELPGHGWVTAAHARGMMTAPGSPTTVANLQALSRGCHHPKTARAWTARRQDPDEETSLPGAVHWTTLAGRDYITYPKNWREALTDPGADPPASDAFNPEPDPPPF